MFISEGFGWSISSFFSWVACLLVQVIVKVFISGGLVGLCAGQRAPVGQPMGGQGDLEARARDLEPLFPSAVILPIAQR